MKTRRIPLKERINRIRQGHAGDSGYDISVIRHFFDVPIRKYLAGFEKDYERLLECLGLSREEASHMTYGDVARKTAFHYRISQTKKKAEEALGILARPFEEAGKPKAEEEPDE